MIGNIFRSYPKALLKIIAATIASPIKFNDNAILNVGFDLLFFISRNKK